MISCDIKSVKHKVTLKKNAYGKNKHCLLSLSIPYIKYGYTCAYNVVKI